MAIRYVFHASNLLQKNLIIMADRGLLLKPEWAAAFVEGKKCLEIRSQNVRCLKKGDLVYILASGQGTNSRGVHVVQIVGSMEFVRAQQITDQDMFESLRSKHQVEYAAFCALSRGSNNKKDKEIGQTSKFSPCFGWEFTNIRKLDTSKWIPWRNDSRHIVFFSVVTLVCLNVFCLISSATRYSHHSIVSSSVKPFSSQTRVKLFVFAM